jgi:hypothetical protein
MRILHIGRHKTGTSSLQHFLSDNAASFARSGVLYPRALRPSVAHHELAYLCNDRLYSQLPLGEQHRLLESLTALQAEMAGSEHVLLSSEAFQNVQPQRVAQHLGRDLTIVVYLREQFQYLVSAYAQAVQNQKITVSLREYERHLFRADYERFLAPWVQVFGESRVMVRLFERDTLLEGDIRTDFIRSIGIPVDLIGHVRQARRHNMSIGGALLDFKRRLNGQAFEALVPPAELYGLLEAVAARHPELVAPTVDLGAMADAVRARYAQSNEAVRRKYFPQRTALFATPPPPAPTALPPRLGDVARALNGLRGDAVGRELLELIRTAA